MNETYVSRGELQRQRYLRTGCQKPWSRKALKRLMPDNPDLTSWRLYLMTGRLPGKGKTRQAIRNKEEADRQDQELRTQAAEAKTKAKRVQTQVKAPEQPWHRRVMNTVGKMFGRNK